MISQATAGFIASLTFPLVGSVFTKVAADWSIRSMLLAGVLWVATVTSIAVCLVSDEGADEAPALYVLKPGDPDYPRITLERDCPGVSSEVHSCVRRLVLSPEIRAAYGRVNAVAQRFLLLNGPSGLGKTRLAMCLAGSSGLPLIMCPAPGMVTKYVGDSVRFLRQVFDLGQELAAKYGGAIILMDEIDAIAAKRSQSSSGGDREYNSIINALLLLLRDGIRQNTNIVFVAATNRVEVLDRAFLDRCSIVSVEAPDFVGRLELLRYCLKAHPHASDVPQYLQEVALATDALVPSKLAEIIAEAARCAADRSGTEVEVGDVKAALEALVPRRNPPAPTTGPPSEDSEVRVASPEPVRQACCVVC